jgi:bifunctional protein TilS/HprT
MEDREKKQPAFVHRSEAAFARILDFYCIEWQYEPRTFPLEWDEEGRVTEAFSPDFYLPGQDLYVELTTVRPRLLTVKNRKLRRMRELYPDVQVKLLRRQDLRDLLTKYGDDQEAARIAGTGAQDPGA